MSYTGKKVAVVGLGVNNTPLVQFLVGQGAEVTVLDRQTPEELQEYLKKLAGLPVVYHLGPDYLDYLKGQETVFLSPGVPQNYPAFQKAKAEGTIFSSELGLFFSVKKSPVIGITGTSGKTTTTALTGAMLTGVKPVKVGGNIGRPPLSFLPELSPETWVVLELSSFQLQNLGYSPDIAVMLNVTPNHLDVHTSWEEYVAAKAEIIRRQSAGDIAVFNWDNAVTRRLAGGAKGKVYYFSRRTEPARGAFIRNGSFFLKLTANTEEYLCRCSESRIPGTHNQENILAAALAARLAGAPPDEVVKAIREFEGVEHRLEPVRELDGVSYYNDSIATTPEQAVAGLLALSAPIVLIAGGYDKKLPFAEFAGVAVRRCRVVILLGKTAEKIREALARAGEKAGVLPEIYRASSLKEARSEEHTSELQSRPHLVCCLLLDKKKMRGISIMQHDLIPHYTIIFYTKDINSK